MRGDLHRDHRVPYLHLGRATAGLRGELRRQMVDAGAVGTARWDTLAVTGPVETTDACGRTSFEYRAELPL